MSRTRHSIRQIFMRNREAPFQQTSRVGASRFFEHYWRFFVFLCNMKLRIGLHILYWVAFWLLFAYTYSHVDGNLGKYLIVESLLLPARIVATYTAFWFFERSAGLGARKTLIAFLGTASAVFAGGMVNRIIKMAYVVPVLFPEKEPDYSFWDLNMVYDVFDVVLTCFIALSIRMYFRQQNLLRREETLRSEKLQAELQALKNQIHPHFLFNTINNLYALARVKSDKTAPVALQLAQMLRYILYESNQKTVPLQQEIKLLEDYIALEKLRYDDDRLQVNFQVSSDNSEQTIAPLLLLPLVENAFKHGVSEQYDNAVIRITIVLKNNILEMNIENTLPEEPVYEAPGLGQKNMRRQLELLYPGRHTLEFDRDQEKFRARLVVNLK